MPGEPVTPRRDLPKDKKGATAQKSPPPAMAAGSQPLPRQRPRRSSACSRIAPNVAVPMPPSAKPPNLSV